MRSELHVPSVTYQKAFGHLFSNMETEHAAFLYARISNLGARSCSRWGTTC